MVFIGYHASHEQLPPSVLLDSVRRAEDAGFDGAMCSDHFAPWGVRQGESNFHPRQITAGPLARPGGVECYWSVN